MPTSIPAHACSGVQHPYPSLARWWVPVDVLAVHSFAALGCRGCMNPLRTYLHPRRTGTTRPVAAAGGADRLRASWTLRRPDTLPMSRSASSKCRRTARNSTPFSSLCSGRSAWTPTPVTRAHTHPERAGKRTPPPTTDLTGALSGTSPAGWRSRTRSARRLTGPARRGRRRAVNGLRFSLAASRDAPQASEPYFCATPMRAQGTMRNPRLSEV